MSILRSEALTQTYLSGGRELTVLRDITFSLEPGSSSPSSGRPAAARGRCSACSRASIAPTSGRVLLDGADLPSLSEDERARLRAESVGFVFQSFHLIPTLTARENVQVPLELAARTRRGRGDELLDARRPRRPRPPLPRAALGR